MPLLLLKKHQQIATKQILKIGQQQPFPSFKKIKTLNSLLQDKISVTYNLKL